MNLMTSNFSFTDGFPTCTSQYCYDFIVWVPSIIYDLDGACQQYARDEEYWTGGQNYYHCDAQPNNNGYDVYCCMYGG